MDRVTLIRAQRRVLEEAEFVLWDATDEARADIRAHADILELGGGDIPGQEMVWSESKGTYIELIAGWYVQLTPTGVAEVWPASAYRMTWAPAEELEHVEPNVDQGAALAKLYAFGILYQVEDAFTAALRLARHALHAELDGDSPRRFRALEHAAANGLLGGGRQADRIAGTTTGPAQYVRVRRELDGPVEAAVAQRLIGTDLDLGQGTGVVRAVELEFPTVLILTLEVPA